MRHTHIFTDRQTHTHQILVISTISLSTQRKLSINCKEQIVNTF